MRARKGRVEMIVGDFEMRRDRPQEWLDLGRGLHGPRHVAGEDTSLQLAHPVPADRYREARIPVQATLECRLCELRAVERGQARGEAAQRHDQPQLPGDDVDDETELQLTGEFELALGVSLHVWRAASPAASSAEIRLQLL